MANVNSVVRGRIYSADLGHEAGRRYWDNFARTVSKEGVTLYQYCCIQMGLKAPVHADVVLKPSVCQIASSQPMVALHVKSKQSSQECRVCYGEDKFP